MKPLCMGMALLASVVLLSQCGLKDRLVEQSSKNIRQQHDVRPSDQANLYMTKLFSQVFIHAQPKEFLSNAVNNISPERISVEWSIHDGKSHPSQWITLNAYTNTALKKLPNAKASPEWFFKMHTKLFLMVCEDDAFSYEKNIENTKIIQDYRYLTYALTCSGVMQPQGGKANYEALFISITGKKEYYVLQWLAYSPYSSAPVIQDKEKWQKRLQQLLPIGLSDNFPKKHPGLSGAEQ